MFDNAIWTVQVAPWDAAAVSKAAWRMNGCVIEGPDHFRGAKVDAPILWLGSHLQP